MCRVTFKGCNFSFNIYFFCGKFVQRVLPSLNRSKPIDALRILSEGTQTDPVQNQVIWTQVDKN